MTTVPKFFKSSFSADTANCVEVAYQTSSFCDTGSCVEVAYQASSFCDSATCVQVGFHKASFSADGECVEVGFHKASRSSTNGSCVEARICDCDEVLVRDSKDQTGPVLTFTRAEWSAFLAGVKAEEFELPVA